MSIFNFYINVDRCLNNSNFDMFFYRQQKERRFAMFNVNSADKDAWSNMAGDIRSYMDRSPFLVRDFRLVFGIRTRRKLPGEMEWKDTIFCQLLSIYYALFEAKVYIRSREKADKSVSLIVLYETDLTPEMPSLGDYDPLIDLQALEQKLGIKLDDSLTGEQLQNTVNESTNLDAATKHFLNDYAKELLTQGNGPEDVIDFRSTEEALVSMIPEESPIGDGYNFIAAYIEKLIGHYCVFLKEIDKNTIDQNMMALLSLVDYITSDLYQGNEEVITNETLKQQSRKLWAQAADEGALIHKYGDMISRYLSRLGDAKSEVGRKLEAMEHEIIDSYHMASEEITETEGMSQQNQQKYVDDLTATLKAFHRQSIHTKKAKALWEKTYQGLNHMLDDLDEQLKIYAAKLTSKYREVLKRRGDEFKRKYQKTEKYYSVTGLQESINTLESEKKSLLDQLKKPQMIPALSFQDQLNMQNQLEATDKEVRFYVKCQAMILPINFLIIFAVGGGLFVLHYLIMQTYALSHVNMAAVMGVCILLTLVLFAACWIAPYRFFQKRIHKALKLLEEKMDDYINGYFEKASAFSDYINLLNSIDEAADCIDLRKEQLRRSKNYSKRLLWHKSKIEEHIQRAEYFDNMSAAQPYIEGDEEKISVRPPIDFEKDVISNSIYWPQEGQGRGLSA